jgi:O-antigen ligase
MAAAMAIGVVIMMVAASYSLELAAVPVAILGAALLFVAVRYVVAHPVWLPGVLILIELINATWFLSGTQRALFHYGLVTAFCLPLLPAVWRNRRIFREGGFKLYAWYFVWCAITISYSLAPSFSLARMFTALLGFGTLTLVASQVKGPQDVRGTLTPLLWACGAVVALVALSAVVLPQSFVWAVPAAGDAEITGSVVRFCSLFNGPNEIGGLMLVTVGCAAVLWPDTKGRGRLLLAALIVMAMGASVLADSRTPFVALAVGATCYFLWRYRGRAIIVLLLLALLAGGAKFKLSTDSYLSRGNVETLTGRTNIWKFAISQIEQRPLLGYGYEVGGAILQSRYFPIWWGPWDEGPQSSLHDGYIDRAVCEGVPALLLWLFIVLRPWISLFRQQDDPWRLKPLAFWMVIPMLVHNLAEASIADCFGLIGLGFFLIWAICERARLQRREDEIANLRRAHAALPAAAAALTASLFTLLALVLLADPARAQADGHFTTLPPHAALPSGAQCAAAVSKGTSWEPRPANYTANHTTPSLMQLMEFHLAPIKGTYAPISAFLRVDGNFTGTTDQILRWGACKWGIDENLVRAQAIVESDWNQQRASDRSFDKSQCPPGGGYEGAWNGVECQESYGIMQVKFANFNGWPLTKNSTAFNVDFRLAYQRACMNGEIQYLSQQTPAGDYPLYPLGSPQQMLWGCIGDWYTGAWYDSGALRYIGDVRAALENKKWTRPGF